QFELLRAELAEQRRHFDEQLAEQRRYTDEQFELLRAELAEQRRHFDEQLAEQRRYTDEQFELLRAELAEQRRRSDEQFELLRAELAEQRRHTDAQFEQLRQQLGGLSMTVGYALEDLAYYYLPELLQRDYGIEIVEGLTRTFVQDQKGYYVEVNIWGEARQDGRTLQIIGEAKSQLSKRTIDQFIKARVERLGKLYPNLFPVMVAFMVSEPDVFEYARQKGVTIYLSYQFQPRGHPLLPST
ncbi:MAG: hypothetical protein NZL85_05015, partial [Fimbriimonadales bacterium]|nr:hypothetical protein [Fimbriimonadales bacterium]